jgi:2-iminobutanoate/2-iminopropanoate deaminase
MKAIGPYSPYVKKGGFIFVSGQLGIDREGKIAGDIEIQTRKAIENLIAVVEEAGGRVEGIAKVTVYLKDMADFNVMNRVYSEYFKTDPPARTTVGVAALPKEALIELDAVVKV